MNINTDSSEHSTAPNKRNILIHISPILRRGGHIDFSVDPIVVGIGVGVGIGVAIYVTLFCLHNVL